jgi:hypothetical protein
MSAGKSLILTGKVEIVPGWFLKWLRFAFSPAVNPAVSTPCIVLKGAGRFDCCQDRAKIEPSRPKRKAEKSIKDGFRLKAFAVNLDGLS